MAITITEGFTWANGNTVMPTRLNTAIRSIVISLATQKLLGRSTAGTGAVEEIDCTAVGRAVIGAADAAAQRTALGLVIGTDVQAYDADLAAIAALSTTSYGRAFLALADAAAGRTALGVAIGTDVQAYDSDLAAIAALTTTSYGRAFLALADAAAGRTALGVVIGTDVQAYDADLAAIAALSTTSYGRAFLALADAAAGRTALGVAIGTDVQAYDADLAAIAALTTTSYGRAFLALADAAAARTAVGLFGSNLESSNTGQIQAAGSTGVDLVYDTSGAASLTLSAGTWLLWGSVTARTNDLEDEIWCGLRDTTNSVDFAKGASCKESGGIGILHQLSCFGYYVVASGTPTIRMKAFRAGSTKLELGTVNGISAAIRAVRLNT